MMLRNFILLFAVLLLFSCEKDARNEEADIDYTKEITIRSNNFSLDLGEVSQEIRNFLVCADDQYGMEAVCSCTCSDLLETKNRFDSCGSYFTSKFSFDDLLCSDNCEDFKEYFAINCNIIERLEILNKADSLLNTELPHINSHEKPIIQTLLTNIRSKTKPDFISLRQQWYNLPSSNGGNYASALALETVRTSYFLHYQTNIYGFDDTNEDDVEALWGKLAGMGYALIGAPLVRVGWDLLEHCNDQQWEINSVDDLYESTGCSVFLAATR